MKIKKAEGRDKKRKKYINPYDWTWLHFWNPSTERKKSLRYGKKLSKKAEG